MRLAISNIAWEKYDDHEIFQILRAGGVEGIEVAPTKIWPEWQGATDRAARKCAAILHNEGFCVPAFQSIVYGKPELKIFESENSRFEFLEHLKLVTDLASCFDAKVLVYGAPQNRMRGDLSLEKAFDIATDLFFQAGTICAKRNVCLAIEMNPPQYGCDFLNNSSDTLDLVKRINHQGIKLHIDVAAMKLADEDETDIIKEAKDYLEHYHISEPFLGDFGKPESNHRETSEALNLIGYKKWVSIEMRMVNSPKQSIKKALDFVRSVYFNIEGQ